MGWHIVITEEMRALGLSGNDLVVFALINGFSQDGQGCFYGSLSYICETCGIARRTAIYILQGLVDRGFVTKTETMQNGVKYVAYQASAKNAQVVQKMHLGSAEIAPNNKEDIKINNTLSNKSRGQFQKPSIEEIRQYCTEKSLDIDAEQFFNFYESKGWVIGKSPMKNWKAAVATWAGRQEKERKSQTKSAPSQKKESVFEHNLKVMDQMYGTNLHQQTYGKKEAYDEQ